MSAFRLVKSGTFTGWRRCVRLKLGPGVLLAASVWAASGQEIVPTATGGLVMPSEARVGELGDVQRLLFTGAETFSAAALRRGLETTSDFQEVAHPLALLAEYLRAIERKLSQGYQHHGFPQARVSAQPDAAAELIRVRLEAGPRYVCGRVKVVGVGKEVAKAIVKRVTVNNPASASERRAFNFIDRPPDGLSADESTPKTPGQIESHWVKGQPAPLSDYDRQRLQWEVTDELCNWGFFFSDVELVIERDDATRAANLIVEVRAVGPRRYADRIDITGNQNNSREALLRYLELQPGMELTRQRVAGIVDRLWRAGRFLDFKVAVGAPDAVKRVPLRIEVREYDQAPSVDQEFSPVEQAMLKTRQWLARLDKRGEDVVVAVSGFPKTSPGFEVILSPRGELAVLPKQQQLHSREQCPGGFIMKPGALGLYSPERGRKLVVPCTGVGFKTFISETANEAAAADKPFNFELGANINHDAEGVKVPACLEMTVTPVAALGLAHQKDCAYWFDGGRVICSNASWLMKSDVSTGRILEFSIKSQVAGEPGLQLRFEPGHFRQQAKVLERTGADLADAYRTNAPLSSSLGFLAEEILESKWLPPLLGTNVLAATWEHLPGLLRALKLSDVLLPLNRLVQPDPALASGKPEFVVPEAEANPPSPTAWLGTMVFPVVGKVLPARSWPRVLTREATLVAIGRTKYTGATVEQISSSPDTGPLGCLAAGALSVWAKEPTQAGTSITLARERLSAADFRRDCQAFWDDQSILGQCLGNFATALRSAPEEDWRGVADSLPARAGEFLQDAARCLRESKGQSSRDALAPALDALWETVLKEKLSAVLGAEAGVQQ